MILLGVYHVHFFEIVTMEILFDTILLNSYKNSKPKERGEFI